MRKRRSPSFRGAPVTLFALGFLAGAAWRRRPATERAPWAAAARRLSSRPGEPRGAPGTPPPGGERASVLGYQRAPAPPAPPPEPQVPSGAPGHRILSG